MLGLEMLDVAIGVIFVYLLLSLICSALNEFIEAKLKLRAVDLEQGIRELLNEPNGADFVKKVYDHPLIYSLFRGKYDPAEIRNVKNPDVDNKYKRYSRGTNLPSYIPAKNFALALMDVVLPAANAVAGGSSGAVAPENANLPTPNAAGLQQPPVKANPLAPLRLEVEKITTNNHIKTALLTIIDAAGDDAIKAREGIENWYNSSMDRVSGWYKRRVQTVVFCMGFGIAIVMNADTFAIFSNLVNDRPLRSAVVATALDKKYSLQDTSGESLRKNVNGVLELGLPIGWQWKSSINPHAKSSNLSAIPMFNAGTAGDLSYSLCIWFLKIMGWVVTGLAVSLGAPFWFDILNKIMVVRSTVKPHEKSKEEASEDKQ